MTTNSLRSARAQQTRREFDALQQEVDAWIEKWKKEDAVKEQYHTQLTTLGGILTAALGRLRDKIGAVTSAGTSGDLFRTYNDYDMYLLWVRQVWDYFRVKFDQRLDIELAPVLKAADEVVWSCYAPVFRHKAVKAARVAPGPAPLPYIDTEASPAALPRDRPGALPAAQLTSQKRKEMEAYFARLPIPLVRLPQNCLRAPWWLIFIGHEVGHHVQHDLLPDNGLVTRFGEALNSLAAASGGDAARAGLRWLAWREELFADAFSVYALGRPAAAAMAWLDRPDDAAMWQSRTDETYPPPGLRMEFLAGLSNMLMEDGATAAQSSIPEIVLLNALRDKQQGHDEARQEGAKPECETSNPETPSEETKAVLAERARMEALIAHLKASPLFHKTDLFGSAADSEREPPKGEPVLLADLCPFSREAFLPRGTAFLWRDALTSAQVTRAPETAVDSARLVAAGGAAAWAKAMLLPDDVEREVVLERLRKNLPSVLVQSAESGKRAGTPTLPQQQEKFGEELIDLLFQLGSS